MQNSNQHFIFLNGGLPEQMTGIESSALKRYQLFERQLGVVPIYVSFRYNLNPPRVIELFKEQGKVSENFQYINLYSYYQQRCANPRQPNQKVSEQLVNVVSCDGKKSHSEYYDERGRISHVNHYDSKGSRIKLDNYDRDGYLFRSVILESETKKRLLEIFYRRDGSVCYTKSFKVVKDKVVISNIWVYDEQGMIQYNYSREEDFHTYLLEYYLSTAFDKNDMISIIGDRGRDLIYALNRKNIPATLHTFYMLHSFHLKKPSDMNSDAKNIYFFLKKINEIDNVIVLSPQQKQDIANRFGHSEKLHFVPHTISHLPKKIAFDSRNLYKVVAAGRLSPEKRFDVMISAFFKVVEKIPEATLEIFGKGGLKGELQVLIDKLNLSNNVFLRDYTSDIYAEFSSARCSLMTSEYEGQPLVMLESLSSGCPVVAMNFRYGPSLMLEDGKNGFVVENGDKQAFADRIIEILTNQELTKVLSSNAYASVDRFKEEKVAPLWRKLLSL